MDKRNKMIKRLVLVYNNLNGTNPIRIKDLLSVVSIPVAYKIISVLSKEGIIKEDKKGYRVDWEKFRLFLAELLD